MGFSSCGARAYMLGARIGVRAAEDGHLTHLAAHAALRRMGAWHEWLLLVATLATHPMRAAATGDCRDRALRGDRALIIKGLSPSVAEKKSLSGTVSDREKIHLGATVKATGFYGR
jgi:hypothetical protein